ncbi:apolipoprotein D-like isoform X1 [Scyliorhinus torazame]|uniref:apolipoprotein D-like isoform X1 n=1 Tax=Scyliorhinus torazame TaxID=75743 RepID=UPI003B5C754F
MAKLRGRLECCINPLHPQQQFNLIVEDSSGAGTMRVLVSTLLVAFICLIKRAQAVEFGRCQHVELQKNFTIDEYLGTWYEIERLYNISGERKCISETISRTANSFDDRLEFLTRMIKEDGEIVALEGELLLPSKGDKAKLQYKIQMPGATMDGGLDQPRTLHYWVLETDYTSYSLVFSCVSFLGLAHTPYAWLLSRDRQLSENTTNHLYNLLTKYQMHLKDIVKVDQTDCKV